MLGIEVPHLITDPKMFVDKLVNSKGTEEKEFST